MLCRDVVEGDAYLWTVLAGVVPEITVNDRTVTNQQWPPGVRTRTAIAAMLFRWVSVTSNHVTIQPERKISKTFKTNSSLHPDISYKNFTPNLVRYILVPTTIVPANQPLNSIFKNDKPAQKNDTLLSAKSLRNSSVIGSKSRSESSKKPQI